VSAQNKYSNSTAVGLDLLLSSELTIACLECSVNQYKAAERQAGIALVGSQQRENKGVERSFSKKIRGGQQ
jgi:hypothetical protein